jgi:hypothetical protein
MAKANIFYFNPTCELAVANGSFSYMPPLLLQEMERDLATLPFVFATKTDFVLTDDAPSEEFKQQLIEAGFELPAFCSLAELESLPPDSFNAIYPWGWSPAAHFKLRNLKEKCGEEFKASPGFNWTNRHKTLFERSTSLDFLMDLLDKYPHDGFIDRSMIGVRVSDTEEIESLLLKNRALVLKAPLSSSGRGIQIIRKEVLNNSNKQWISGVLKQQNYLIAEPFLDKLIDFSFQFNFKKSGIDYLGTSFFETNTNGQYQATLIRPDLKQMLAGIELQKLETRINSIGTSILEALRNSAYAKLHRGYLGVDAMIFNHQNQIRIQPCIEINCRMNMGILSLVAATNIHAGSTGYFRLFYGQQGKYERFATDQNQLNPWKVYDGKPYSGFLPLVEPSPQKKFGAYISLATAR